MTTKESVRITVGASALLLMTLSVLPNVPDKVAVAQGQSSAPGQQRGTLEQPLFMAARFVSGQNVAPVFEGWEPNPDGTFSMYFGYMNRNWEEELDVPVGDGNFFAPGPQDRGQPTHFVPRRQKNAFRVIVPKDFGEKSILVWTLSLRGKTETVQGSIRPEHQVDVSRDREDGNTPPVVKQVPDQAITLPATASLTVEVTDDGLPKARSEQPQEPQRPQQPVPIERRRGPGPPLKEEPLRGLAVYWMKYRGPGQVTFAPGKQRVVDGKATTTAAFSAPGDYVIQVVADDGTGSGGAGMDHCCWTPAQIKVAVRPPTDGAPR